MEIVRGRHGWEETERRGNRKAGKERDRGGTESNRISHLEAAPDELCLDLRPSSGAQTGRSGFFASSSAVIHSMRSFSEWHRILANTSLLPGVDELAAHRPTRMHEGGRGGSTTWQ